MIFHPFPDILQGVWGSHPADVNTQHVYSVGGARALRLCHICEDITGPGGGKQCTQWVVKLVQMALSRPLTLQQIIHQLLHILVLMSVKAYIVKAYHGLFLLFVSAVSTSKP